MHGMCSTYVLQLISKSAQACSHVLATIVITYLLNKFFVIIITLIRKLIDLDLMKHIFHQAP